MFWVAGTKAAAQLITWAATIVVVRIVSPQDYGLMGIAMLCLGLLQLFNEIGLGAAIIQHPDLNANDESDLTWMILLMNGALFVLLLMLAPLIAAYFKEPDLIPILRVLAVTFVIGGIGTPAMSMLSRQMAFRKKAQAEVAGSLVGAFSTVILAVAGNGVWSLVFGHVARQLVTTAFYCSCSPLKVKRTFAIENVRRFISFGLQVASARVLWFVSSNSDFVIVGRMLGTTQLGYYAMAFQFSSIPIDKIVTIVGQVAFPVFATLQKEPETLKRYYLGLVAMIAFLTFPMFLGLFLVADDAVLLLLGSKWLPVAFPLKVLCVVACLRAIETMNAPAVLATGKPRIVVSNNLIQALVMPLSFYVGAHYGVKGVAISWILAWPVLFSIVTAQTLSLIGLAVRSYVNELKHFILASVVMGVVVRITQNHGMAGWPPVQRLVWASMLGGVTYFAYVWVFRRDVFHEALELIRRRRHSRATTRAAGDEAHAVP